MSPRYALLGLLLCVGCTTSITSIPSGALIENKTRKTHKFSTEFDAGGYHRVTPYRMMSIPGDDHFRVKWPDGIVSEWQTPRNWTDTLLFKKESAPQRFSVAPPAVSTPRPSTSTPRERPQRDTRPPEVTIISPAVTPGMTTASEAKDLTIRGRATDESGVYEVLVNGEEATLTAGGYFDATVLLAVGANKIEITATDIKRNVQKVSFTIVRGELLPVPTVVPRTP